MKKSTGGLFARRNPLISSIQVTPHPPPCGPPSPRGEGSDFDFYPSPAGERGDRKAVGEGSLRAWPKRFFHTFSAFPRRLLSLPFFISNRRGCTSLWSFYVLSRTATQLNGGGWPRHGKAVTPKWLLLDVKATYEFDKGVKGGLNSDQDTVNRKSAATGNSKRSLRSRRVEKNSTSRFST